MRTRAQVNAWNELTSRHRREVEAQAVASRQLSLGSQQQEPPTPAAVAPTTFVTPTKNKKRKLSAAVTPTNPEKRVKNLDGDGVAAVPTESENSTRPTPTKKLASIRRTLKYNDTDTDRSEQSADTTEQKPQLPSTPAWILECISNGRSVGNRPVVGRADERQQIESVLSPTCDASARAVFVIGPPGTGKSSCVAQVAQQHAKKAAVTRINCSMFTSPAALFTAIADALAFEFPSLDASHQLDAFLTSNANTFNILNANAVLVLDEVDHLIRLPVTHHPRVRTLLRFFIHWTQAADACLTFIGILNGMDMHAQILQLLASTHESSASTAPTRIVLFPSYTHEQLLDILNGYVHSSTQGRACPQLIAETIDVRALELIARKVAARDGDARRAVGLLQQAARASVSSASTPSTPSTPSSTASTPKLSMRDVLQVMNQAIGGHNAVAKQIQQLPRQPKLLLYAITRLAPSDHTSSTTLDAVVDELYYLQSSPALAWIPRLRADELQQSLGALDCYALVKQTPASSKTNWKLKVASAVAMDTVLKALQSDELLRGLASIEQ